MRENQREKRDKMKKKKEHAFYPISNNANATNNPELNDQNTSEHDMLQGNIDLIMQGLDLKTPLQDLHSAKKQQEEFIKSCYGLELEHCIVCKERWFSLNLLNEICKNCNSEIKDHSFSNFSMQNDIDPKLNLLRSQNLPELCETEEMLMSRVHVVMKCYRLESGSISYK